VRVSLKSEVATEDEMIAREEVGGRSLRRLSPLILLRMTLTPHLQAQSIVENLIRRCTSAYQRVRYRMKRNYDDLGDVIKEIYQGIDVVELFGVDENR
jgi:hypothetical protein